MKLSARNLIPARVTSITSGEAIANVHLDANGISLVASIGRLSTSNSSRWAMARSAWGAMPL